MEYKGKLIKIGVVHAWTTSFKSRKFIIETEGEYPQFLTCELHQGDCEKLDGRNEGDQVSIAIEARGRKWTDPKDNEKKYFNSLKCFKMDFGVAVPAAVEQSPVVAEESDDLPF